MKSVCVFAGSSPGSRNSYQEVANNLGKEIVKNSYSMVFGGGNVGLMGVTADSVLNAGGKVIGVITERLHDVEVAHKGLTELFIVETMHERKKKMAELSDSIISLPGGVGTWEEFFEALAWNQLGIHSKPVILINTDNYYSDLFEFVKKSVEEGFLPNSSLEDFYLAEDEKEAVEIVRQFEPKNTEHWYKRLER